MTMASAAAAALVAATLSAVVATPATAAPNSVRELPIPTGVRTAYPVAFALDGRVLGGSGQTNGFGSPTTWSPSGAVTVLDSSPGAFVRGGNLRGDLVGARYTGGTSHATLWRDERVVDLHPAGAASSQAMGVSDLGQVLVAGFSADATSTRLTLWENGRSRLIRDGGGYPDYAIGENGHVAVATQEDDGTGVRAVVRVWKNGRFTSTTTLPAGVTWRTIDVSRTGVVAGAVGANNSNTQPAVVRGGTFTKLPAPTGYTGTFTWPGTNAQAVNGMGDVIGSATTPTGEQHAVVWRNGVPTVLTPGVATGSAFAVNEFGAVTGDTTRPDGVRAAFLWRGGTTTVLPVPEGRNARGLVLHPYLPRVAGFLWSPEALSEWQPTVWG